jgi:UDP-glucose 4-epimerase
MNILIIGGAGFIGVELIKHLQNLTSHNLIALDNNLNRVVNLVLSSANKFCVDATNPLELDKVIVDKKIDGIVHLAANSDIKSGSLSSDMDFQNTLVTSLALAEIVKKNQFKFLLFASTSAVYGNLTKSVSLYDSSIKNPISHYGWAKLGSEYALSLAAKTSETPFILARFPNVVGSKPTHGVLFDFKEKLLKDNQKFEVLGDGKQTKPYLHVEDLCRILIRAIDRSVSASYCELNITPGDSIQLTEIVKIVLEITGFDPLITYGSTPFGWIGDVPSYAYADSLPQEYEDLELRNSANAVRDAFEASWNDK